MGAEDIQPISSVSSRFATPSTLSRAQRLGAAIARRPVLSCFLIALVVRVLVATGIFVLYGGFLFEDDTSYSQMAEEIVLGLDRRWDPYTHYLLDTTRTFLFPLTWLYEVFGPQPLLGQLFVASMGAAAAALVAVIAREVWDHRAALITGGIVALLPSQVLWSTLILKDAQVWMLLAAMGVAIVVSLRMSGWRLATCLFGAGIALTGLAFLREHTMVVAAWAGMAALAFGAREQRAKRAAGGVLIAALVPALGGYGFFGTTLVLERGSLQERRIANAAGADSAFVDVEPPSSGGTDTGGVGGSQGGGKGEGEGEKHGGSARDGREGPRLEEGSDQGALEADLRHLPRGLVYVLLAPFPWDAGENAAVDLARLETVVWYPTLFLAAIGIVIVLRNRDLTRRLLFPLLAGAGSLAVYALTEGNVGTAYRHRGEIVWAVALLATAAVVRRRRQPSDP